MCPRRIQDVHLTFKILTPRAFYRSMRTNAKTGTREGENVFASHNRLRCD